MRPLRTGDLICPHCQKHIRANDSQAVEMCGAIVKGVRVQWVLHRRCVRPYNDEQPITEGQDHAVR